MRLARLYAPGLPQLVQARFALDLQNGWTQAPEKAPLDLITEWLRHYSLIKGIKLHGWSLAPQALLLLATPCDRQSIAGVIQSVGRQLSAHLKSGGVFIGRYRNCVIEPGQWVLPALIWVESAPARGGCSPNALAWRWSSAAQHCGQVEIGGTWVQDHYDYWRCGNTPFDRQATYRSGLLKGLSAEKQRTLEAALQGQWALGSDAFVRGLDQIASRRVQPGQRGRPRKLTQAANR